MIILFELSEKGDGNQPDDAASERASAKHRVDSNATQQVRNCVADTCADNSTDTDSRA